MLQLVFDGVYRVALPWSNAWLLTRDGEVVLIDSGTARDRRHWRAILDSEYSGRLRLHSVLLTHGHCDHAGNMVWLAERYDARVHAHIKEAKFLATRRTYVPRGRRALSRGGLLFALGEVYWPVRRRRPDVLLADGDRIETPLGPLTAVSTPGHTPGHVSYFHEGEGWLFAGDALLNVVPWVRCVGLSLPMTIFTSDVAEARRSVRRLAELQASALLAGHGPPHVENTATAIRKFARRLPG